MWSPSQAKPLSPTNRRIDLNKERRISEPQCLVLLLCRRWLQLQTTKIPAFIRRIYQLDLTNNRDWLNMCRAWFLGFHVFSGPMIRYKRMCGDRDAR
jgi:hypothetical protein